MTITNDTIVSVACIVGVVVVFQSILWYDMLRLALTGRSFFQRKPVEEREFRLHVAER